MSRYIDADILKDKTTRVNNIWNSTTNAEGKGLDEIIDDIPTADVRENVKGEWIEDNSREKSMMWRCSVCGRIAYYPTIGKRKGFKKHCGYHYCPWCGADMRGE